ncbi:MAG: murein biosynthesis integral membrane protein MurJ [Bdellovibrionales bacterium]|nr:murein biosynthesis integral membrane protein MurJ [Bdellovibrionales bacterium]
MNSVLKSAGAMSAGTFLSRILGLVREQVFAVLFGAQNVTDAFNIAFRIPNLLRDLFAEGAMSSALVPTFTQVRKKEGDRRAWQVAGRVFRVLFVLVSLLAVAGGLFAENLVALYASHFKNVPGKFEMTVELTRILFPFFPLVALAAAYMGILNAVGRFFIPAFASALFNLTSIIVGVLCAWLLPAFGIQPIVGMAIGVVLGGAVQAFCQLPSLYSSGYRFMARQSEDPAWSKDPALRSMMALMIPGTIGLAATQINVLVNSVLATSQGTGAVSWLNYAFRLMQFPIGLFGVSFAAATLPRASAFWVDRDFKGLSNLLDTTLKQVFAVNFPAAAGLAFLGYPIIQLLFQYGNFYPEDTASTAKALAAYSVGLGAYSAVKVLVPACYAVGVTRIAVISSILSVALTLAFNLTLIQPLGFMGLALGTSLAATFNCLFLLIFLKRRIHQVGGEWRIFPIFKAALVHGTLAMAMGWLCWFSYQWVQGFFAETWARESMGTFGAVMVRGFRVGLVILEGIAFVFLFSKVFKIQENLAVIDLFSRKLKKRVSG